MLTPASWKPITVADEPRNRQQIPRTKQTACFLNHLPRHWNELH